MKRHISIIIFVTLFVGIVSIIAILAARGFKFTGNDFKESGILILESEPDNATIYVNGNEEGKTPKNLELVAGTYTIKLEKENYVTWEKQVEIEPSIVTNMRPNLFPVQLNLDQITYTSIDKVFFSQDSNRAIYTVNDNDSKQLWALTLEKSIFELSSTKPEKIADLKSIDETCINSGNYSLSVSPNNQNILLQCSLKNSNLYYLLKNYTQNDSFRNINEEISFNPKVITFGFDSKTLIIQNEQFVLRYDIEAKKTSLLALKNSNSPLQFCQLENSLLLLNDSYDKTRKVLYQINENSEKTEINFPEEKNPNSSSNLFCSQETNDTFILTSKEATYLFQIEQNDAKLLYTLESSSIDITSWSDEAKAFLYKKDSKLFAASIKSYPNGDVKISSERIINDLSKQPIEIVWASNSLHLIMRDVNEKKIYVQDTNGENKRMLYEGEVSTSNSFRLSSNETFLVLLIKDDEENSNLYSLQLKI